MTINFVFSEKNNKWLVLIKLIECWFW